MMKRRLPIRTAWFIAAILLLASISQRHCQADEFKAVPLKQSLTDVQPMTGLVLWTTNEAVNSAPIQLEYSYMTYAQVVKNEGEFDWSPLETLLDEVASRGHQLILRWHDTYVGHQTGVPQYITRLPDYKLTRAKSENKPTEFPDWSHPEFRRFVLDFFSRFAKKYDDDPRLAFVQVGFGLWAEYHIYDGPMRLGETFPSIEYQSEFAQHLARSLKTIPWMISVDAGDQERSAFPENALLLALPFGLFDDSFNHASHKKENEPNWNILGRDRWKRSPTGGEFSFFEKVDQSKALAPNGPHGIPFEKQAADFHVSFIIGDDQPRFQKPDRIRAAGMACGYRFQIEKFEASETRSRVMVRNIGIAPIYYDAYPAVNNISSQTSLKGLLPDEVRSFDIPAGGLNPTLTIECRRLAAGQKIGFVADLR
jgi:hypothetical protein